MFIMYNLYDVKLNYIFIVKIFYKVKGFIVVYLMEFLLYRDLFSIVSLFQVGFGLKGIILFFVYMIDEEYVVKEIKVFFFDFFCML